MPASNRSAKDCYPLFPNPVLAEGILDQLINKAHHIVVTGRSYRTQLRPKAASGRLPKEVTEVYKGSCPVPRGGQFA